MDFIEKIKDPRIRTYLVVTFIVLIVIIIFIGRILNEINLSKSKSDPRIQTAHKWAAWGVGLSSTIAAITFIMLGLSYYPTKGKVNVPVLVTD